MRHCIEQSNGLVPSWLCPSWVDCIIATRGYDFRKGQDKIHDPRSDRARAVVRRHSSYGHRDEGEGRHRITRKGRIAGSRNDKRLAEKALHAKFKLTPTRAAGSGSFGGIDFPKSDSFQNSASNAFSSIQDLIQRGAFKAMTPRKSTLISLALNCGFQQLNNLIISKYEGVTT